MLSPTSTSSINAAFVLLLFSDTQRFIRMLKAGGKTLSCVTAATVGTFQYPPVSTSIMSAAL